MRSMRSLVVVVAGSWAFVAPLWAQCPLVFGAPSTLIAGPNTISVAAGDINLDGYMDLVSANQANSTVSVLLGMGDGTFAAAVHFATGLQPNSVVIGDWNNDGKPDIATANVGDNTVTTLMGNGLGSFGGLVSLPVDVTPVVVATGDMNNDGVADLVAAHAEGLLVMIGKGDGAFFVPIYFYFAEGGTADVVVSDIDGDGFSDAVVAIAGGGGLVSILFGDGKGGLSAPMNVTTGGSPSSVAVGDVSGDGLTDIAVTTGGVQGIALLLANGDGGFLSPIALGGGSARRSAEIVDLNNDGKNDIVAVGGNGASTFLGNGDGTFRFGSSLVGGTNLTSVVVEDFNEDGTRDFATGDFNTSNVHVRLATGLSAAITEQPEIQTVPEGGNCEFSVTATGAGSFRWRMNGAPLVDGGAYSGVHTSTLTVSGAGAAQVGVYDVRVGSGCGAGITSSAVALIVQGASDCPTDVNGDGFTNFGDLNLVINSFNFECPR